MAAFLIVEEGVGWRVLVLRRHVVLLRDLHFLVLAVLVDGSVAVAGIVGQAS